MFLNKVFIWTMYKKAFRLEGYVVCFVSVYTAIKYYLDSSANVIWIPRSHG